MSKCFFCQYFNCMKRKRPCLINLQDDIYIEKGVTAKVYQDITNPTVCKKKYNLNTDNNLIINEIYILKNINKIKQVNSPKFIKYDKKENTLYMEYIQGTDLCNYLIVNNNNLPIKKIMKNLLFQINYLHKNEIIHLDLKLDNIIIKLSDFKTYILDWGNSLNLKKKNNIKIFKTPYYQSPESFNKINIKACDIWSLGVILFILTYNTFPFSSNINEEDNKREFLKDIKKIITSNEVNYLKPIENADVIDLMKQMLLKDHNKRITAENALKHKYFNNI